MSGDSGVPIREPDSASAVTVDEKPVVASAAARSSADPAGRRQRSPLTVGERRWLVGILAVATIVRLAWLAYAHVDPPTWYLPSGDSYSYWYYGNEIAHGRGYISYLTG